MEPQIPPVPSASGTTFVRTLDNALTELTAYRNSPDYMLDLGFTEADASRYVGGEMEAHERVDFQQILLQSSYAMRLVTDLVKAKRKTDA